MTLGSLGSGYQVGDQVRFEDPLDIGTDVTLAVTPITGFVTITYPPPAITIVGPNLGGAGISVPTGLLSLINPFTGGNIFIENEITAGNLRVVAGGTFFVDGVSQFEVQGKPYTEFAGATTGRFGINGAGTAWAGTAPFVVGATTNGSLLGQSGTINVPGASSNPLRFIRAATETIGSVLARGPNESLGVLAQKIFIRAEYLNINGILQSGKSDLILNLGAAVENEIALLRPFSGTRFLLPTATTLNPDFTIYFNTANNSIEIEKVGISGGFIDIEGHILNTGNGEIRVLGGYGKIEVNNTTIYNLLVKEVDASKRGAGTLVIKDKAKTDSGAIVATIYQKGDDGVVTKTVDFGTGPNTLTGDGINNWRFGWSVGISQNEIKRGRVVSSSWLFIPLGSNFTAWDSIEVLSQPTLKDEAGYYFNTGSTDQGDYTYNQTIVEDPGVVQEQKSVRKSWYGKKTITVNYTQEVGQTITHTHSVDATRPIDVKFFGYDQGIVNLNSTGGGSVIVEGPVRNPTGTTTIVSDLNITMPTSLGYVEGRVVTLNAQTGIGTAAEEPLNTRVTDEPALSFTGQISFDNITGASDKISRSSGSWFVDGFAAGHTIEVTGAGVNDGTYTIQSVIGATLTLALGDTLVDATVNGVTVDSDGTAANSLPSRLNAVTANGDIYINEQIGDIAIDQVIASRGGEVIINAPGDILVGKKDNGTFEEGLVKGGNVTLTTAGGDVGNGPARPLVLDSSTTDPLNPNQVLNTKVNIDAAGDRLRQGEGRRPADRVDHGWWRRLHRGREWRHPRPQRQPNARRPHLRRAQGRCMGRPGAHRGSRGAAEDRGRQDRAHLLPPDGIRPVLAVPQYADGRWRRVRRRPYRHPLGAGRRLLP